MKIVEGDLIHMALDGEFDVIVHGCNCQHKMGAGIAKQIREEFPEAWEADMNFEPALGRISWATIELPEHILCVVNAYTQIGYGRGRHVKYFAVRECFRKVAKHFENLRVGYPLIGAGLGGGDWDTIAEIIDEELDGMDHTLVEYGR